MNKPRIFLLAGLLMLVLLVAACSGPPETQVYIVLTSTHQPPTLTALAVDGVATEPPPGGESGTNSEGPIEVDASPAMPTPVQTQIQVAEQAFEHGRMFWVQTTREIWVMVDAPDSESGGTWLIFEDTFEEGEDEIDPDLTPPADLLQPRRGFGKLWRQNEEVRQGLGWAISQEFGFVTTYEYRAGGYLDSDGNYIAGPGIHILYSLGNEAFAFEEGDMSWRLIE